MPDFIPSAHGDFAQWTKLQKVKRVTYGAVLGLTPADITRQDAEDAAMLTASEKADQTQAASKSATEERDTLQKKFLTGRRTEIARAKTHPAYTDAIGKDHGWVAREASTESDTLKPVLTPTRVGTDWRFAWTKLGQAYLKLFRRPAGTAEWGRFLAIDSRSPYVDTETGLTGSYEYMGQLFDADDNAVGQPSDIVVAQHG